MLRAIYYSEFDNILGPVVLYDAPSGAVSGGRPCLFDAISDYAITGPQLSGHLITVRAPFLHGHAQRHNSSSYMLQASPERPHLLRPGAAPPNSGGGASKSNSAWLDGNSNHSSVPEVQVVNFPVCISSHEAGRSYHRNALLFNVGLVLDQGAPAQVFSSALRKLALTLRAMELESGFLSGPKKDTLGRLLPRLLLDLNSNGGEATLPLDAANFLSLKLPTPAPSLPAPISSTNSSAGALSSPPPPTSAPASATADILSPVPNTTAAAATTTPASSIPTPSTPTNTAAAPPSSVGSDAPEEPARVLFPLQRKLPEPCDYHVPALLRDPSELSKVDWDLALHRVVPHIDGVKCVKLVALAADVDTDCCKKCLQVLLWHHSLVLLDLFRFSNTYALRPGVAALFAGGAPHAHVNANCHAHLHSTLTSKPNMTADCKNGATGTATSGGVYSNIDMGNNGPGSPASSSSSSPYVDGGDAQGEWLEETIAYVACRHRQSSTTLEQQAEEEEGEQQSPPSSSSLPPRRGTSTSQFDDVDSRTKGIGERYATPMVVPWGSSLLDAVDFADLHGAHSDLNAAALSGGKSSFSAAPTPAAVSPLDNPSDSWYGNSSGGSVAVEGRAAEEAAAAARGGVKTTAAASTSLEVGMVGHSKEGRSRVMITTSGPSSFDRWNRSRGLLFDPTRDISPAAAAARHSSSATSSSSSQPSPNRVLSSTPPNRPPSVIRTATPWGSLERHRNSALLTTSRHSNDLQSVPAPSPLRRARTVETCNPTLRGGRGNFAASASSSLGAVSATATGASVASAASSAVAAHTKPMTSPRTTWMSAPENTAATAAMSQEDTRATAARTPHERAVNYETATPAPEPLDSRPSPWSATTRATAPPMKQQQQQQQQEHLTPRELLSFYLRFGDGNTVRDVVLSSSDDDAARAIDYRRAIAFGVLHGILQRIHAFPVSDLPDNALPPLLARAASLMNQNKSAQNQHQHGAWNRNSASGASGGGVRAHFSSSGSGGDLREATSESVGQTLAVRKLAACAALMDGEHSVDAIATALLLSDREVLRAASALNAASNSASPPVCFLYK